jgi:predicted helicase
MSPKKSRSYIAKEEGARVIFSTYQSTPVLAVVCERHRAPPFDLAIADEAHRCAGIQVNARCLGESVDVRALDGVAFIDPKESLV